MGLVWWGGGYFKDLSYFSRFARVLLVVANIYFLDWILLVVSAISVDMLWLVISRSRSLARRA